MTDYRHVLQCGATLSFIEFVQYSETENWQMKTHCRVFFSVNQLLDCSPWVGTRPKTFIVSPDSPSETKEVIQIKQWGNLQSQTSQEILRIQTTACFSLTIRPFRPIYTVQPHSSVRLNSLLKENIPQRIGQTVTGRSSDPHIVSHFLSKEFIFWQNDRYCSTNNSKQARESVVSAVVEVWPYSSLLRKAATQLLN